MSKTISKKLLYIVVAIAMLAMMIPAMAVSVSATSANGLTMTTVDSSGAQVDDSGYNVIGTTVRVTSTAGPADNWSASPVYGPAATLTAQGANWAEFTSYSTAENQIAGNLVSDGSAVGPIDKKWGTIYTTTLVPSTGSSYVTWNENTKSWFGTATFTDNVTGQFNSTNPANPTHTHMAQGAILNWYLVDGYISVPMAADEAVNLNAAMLLLNTAKFARFANGLTTMQTISGADGGSTVTVNTTGEEAFQIVVVPQYRGDNPQLTTIPEVSSYNFKTREMETVPQVRWAGEKIVLEANFGAAYDNDSYIVRFATTTPNAILEGTGSVEGPFGLNWTNTPQSNWTLVGSNGIADAVLYDAEQGEVNVVATLYEEFDGGREAIVNQEAFTVYYLKLESLTLGNVVGKRAGHDTGLWTPANPVWDIGPAGTVASPDDLAQTLNVSQDALLRARVKGYFVGGDPTTRPAGTVDIGGTFPLALPVGRYVLPDDWATLAGPVNWQERRIHWDIMSAPDDGTTFSPLDPLGNYYMNGVLVATNPVTGPFSPGIETMTDTGWATPNTPLDPLRAMQTVVPNGQLDWWDAPMPPAKIIFEINSGAGFFKTALKTDIYYVLIAGVKNYTNPFYQEMIPAHEAIPPFDVAGGYDWASFGKTGDAPGNIYGPYPFWQIINQPDNLNVPSQDATHPTKVEVYSDNHGEGMVWLNGDANLDLVGGGNGSIDVPFGSTVGITVAQATADYPYFKGTHQAIYSNTVTKTWTWGGQVLGPDTQGAKMVLVAGQGNPVTAHYITLDSSYAYTLVNGQYTLDPVTQANSMGKSDKHVIWVWVTDRDGMQAGVLGSSVQWTVKSGSAYFYNGSAFTGINPLGPNSSALMFDGNGFLLNSAHPGIRATGSNVTTGTSWLRAPTAAESAIFYKFYNAGYLNPTSDNGLRASNFAVAAIDVISSSGVVAIEEDITGPDFPNPGYSTGTITRETDFDNSVSYPLDDTYLPGDANHDGVVNLMDITAVERIILGMPQDKNVQADANCDNQAIGVGDLIRIEKIYYLGN